MKRISLPISQLKSHYDVVVIGSGYGGAISASRLSRAGKSVCLLERGKEMITGEYPNTEIEALCELQLNTPDGVIGSETGLYNIYVNKQQNVVVGCGLGGTSLINANVSLEPKAEVFDSDRWPELFRKDKNALLKDGYELAKDMLKFQPYPDNFPKLNKTEAHRKSASAMKQEFYKVPLNVTFDKLDNNINHVGVPQEICNNCGDCVSGCNVGAKNTTLMNYLPDAWNYGADIFCEVHVSHIEKGKNNWLIHYQLLDTGREKFNTDTLTVSADIVIVSAGTIGSNEIMLRSKENGLSLSEQVGQKFSGNGDILGFAYNCEDEINGIGFGDHDPQSMKPVGPCITSVIDMRHGDNWTSRMVLEEGSIPGALGKLMIPMMATADALIGKNTKGGLADKIKKEARELESKLLGPYHGAVNRMQTYLIMSHDDADGVAELQNNRLIIDWPNVGREEAFIKGNEKLYEATKALGGNFVENPIWTKVFNKSIISVHPLGGCNMADDATNGVVDHKGRVFSGSNGSEVHKGLYISDGSVIPISLAVNPLLTISAVTERCCKLLAQDYGLTIDYTLPSSSERKPAPRKLGIEFTETMKGFISETHNDSDDLNFYNDAYNLGKKLKESIEFTLTIRSDDLDRLLSTPGHKASIIGTLKAPSISSDTLTVNGGEFQLFVEYPKTPDTKHMVYSMVIRDEANTPYHFHGYKVIKDDPDLLDIWPNTTTLYVTIRKGESENDEVIAKGVMHIHPDDFLKQMTTMKVLNAKDEKEKLEALARFGKYFAGVLWETYGGVFAKSQLFNPDAPPRKKRKLKAPAPEVHYFETEDKLTLKLTRYQAGTKGPVMLVHGLGVSSGIFSTDLIKTNLVEYLCAHDYDVWLLDFRVSIDLAVAKDLSNGDQVAKYDFPAAIDKIREVTGKSSVQAVVHCWGASTFFMSMLNGLEGVRSIVCSQIANNVVIPTATKVKTGLHLPTFLDKLGVESLTAYVDTNENWQNRLWDKALSIYAMAEAQGQCNNPVCHRVTFNYASLYKHEQLNELLHENLHELFAEANIMTFEHLATICRKGYITDFDGNNVYLPNIERLNLPISFIHGAENECYLPESTEITYKELSSKFNSKQYSRHVIKGYGHIDCIFGRDAVKDVYPYILEHLDKTAEH